MVWWWSNFFWCCFLFLLLISTQSDSIKDQILYPLREGWEGRVEGRGRGGRWRGERMARLGLRIWAAVLPPWWGFSVPLCFSPSVRAKDWEITPRCWRLVSLEMISDRLPKQLVPHFSRFYTSWSLIYKIDHSLQWPHVWSLQTVRAETSSETTQLSQSYLLAFLSSPTWPPWMDNLEALMIIVQYKCFLGCSASFMYFSIACKTIIFT